MDVDGIGVDFGIGIDFCDLVTILIELAPISVDLDLIFVELVLILELASIFVIWFRF